MEARVYLEGSREGSAPTTTVVGGFPCILDRCAYQRGRANVTPAAFEPRCLGCLPYLHRVIIDNYGRMTGAVSCDMLVSPGRIISSLHVG